MSEYEFWHLWNSVDNRNNNCVYITREGQKISCGLVVKDNLENQPGFTYIGYYECKWLFTTLKKNDIEYEYKGWILPFKSIIN